MPIKIVGNLPFNISIPLILRFANFASQKSGIYKFGKIPLYLVFQKEIAHVINIKL